MLFSLPLFVNVFGLFLRVQVVSWVSQRPWVLYLIWSGPYPQCVCIKTSLSTSQVFLSKQEGICFQPSVVGRTNHGHDREEFLLMLSFLNKVVFKHFWTQCLKWISSPIIQNVFILQLTLMSQQNNSTMVFLKPDFWPWLALRLDFGPCKAKRNSFDRAPLTVSPSYPDTNKGVWSWSPTQAFGLVDPLHTAWASIEHIPTRVSGQCWRWRTHGPLQTALICLTSDKDQECQLWRDTTGPNSTIWHISNQKTCSGVNGHEDFVSLNHLVRSWQWRKEGSGCICGIYLLSISFPCMTYTTVELLYRKM